MSDIFAFCDGCSKKYRVPSAEKTYSCKLCDGTVRPNARGKAAASPRPKARPSKSAVARAKSKPSPAGPGIVARAIGALAFWRPKEDPDAVADATSLDSMDWDVFGADAFDPHAEASLEASSSIVTSPEVQSWREGATAPPIPSETKTPAALPASASPSRGKTASTAAQRDSVRTAFNEFDWD